MTLGERVAQIIDQSRAWLTEEGLAAVCHYRDVDEYEMAFEGLVLELVKNDSKPPEFSYDEWAHLLADLGLRMDSVFVGDLWSVFQEWVQSTD